MPSNQFYFITHWRVQSSPKKTTEIVSLWALRQGETSLKLKFQQRHTPPASMPNAPLQPIAPLLAGNNR